MRKSYWVLWTYIANYSHLFKVEAKDPEGAIELVCGAYSDDFRKRSTIYVFDHQPALIRGKDQGG